MVEVEGSNPFSRFPVPRRQPWEGMAYTTTEGRERLLSALADALDEVGFALADVGAAYELLDDQSAERLEDGLFTSVQRAYGRAKKTQSEFAERPDLTSRSLAAPTEPSAS